VDADAIVVGAGLAGLRCARVLQEAGRHVVVLEAASHVGGRVTSESVDGFTVDRGFQVLNPAYPAVRRWVDLDALALGSFDAGVLVRTEAGMRVVADPRRTPSLAVATLRSGLLDVRDLWGLARWMAPSLVRPQRAAGGPDCSLAEALDRHGVRGDLRVVLERFVSGVAVEPDAATSAQFVRLLMRSFALGRPGLPAGGMRRLPEQLTLGLADVRTDVGVRAVRPTGAVCRVDTDDGSLAARQVVIATGPLEAARLGGHAVPAVHGLTTWWFAVDAPPERRPLLTVDARGGKSPPGPVWNCAVVTTAQPSYAPRGRHLLEATTLLARPDGHTGEADVRAHLADLYGCDPRRWEVVAHHVVPEALPAAPPPLRLTRPVDLGDGVFVCGDHRDTSSIQGALVSGQRAARAALAVR
jgi:glycine/D-amino acid oxidase-like deaminating enzyme